DRSELLKGPEWVVIDLNGAPSVGSDSRATLKFDDATVSGRAFCNYYTATYATTGKKLSIHLTSMTNMACFPETKEELFTDLLGAVNGFEIDSVRTLTLRTTQGSTITARRE